MGEAQPRRYMLLEQIKQIKKELGMDTDEKEMLVSKFRARLQGSLASEKVGMLYVGMSHVVCDMLTVAPCLLHAACCMLHRVCGLLHVASCLWFVACCMLHARRAPARDRERGQDLGPMYTQPQARARAQGAHGRRCSVQLRAGGAGPEGDRGGAEQAKHDGDIVLRVPRHTIVRTGPSARE